MAFAKSCRQDRRSTISHLEYLAVHGIANAISYVIPVNGGSRIIYQYGRSVSPSRVRLTLVSANCATVPSNATEANEYGMWIELKMPAVKEP